MKLPQAKLPHVRFLPALFAASAALLCSCDGTPRPEASADGSLLPGGSAPKAGPVADETRLAGRITLVGAAFDAADATVFVNVRPKGQRGPWLSRKYTMQSRHISEVEPGAAPRRRVLEFELRSADTGFETFNMNGMHEPPEGLELELHACAKAGGSVDLPTLCEAVAPFEKGKSDYALTLTAP